MATLRCPVRGCGEPLERRERSLACARGHSFDLARSGYVNLLQSIDRKSANPGDSREAALARRRVLEAGHGSDLVREILDVLDGFAFPEPGPAVLDVGCGEGYHLGSLAAARAIEGHGIDISTPAIDLAAKRYPDATWIVANADRTLPYGDGAFDAAMSITARRNAPELRRVLSDAGVLLVAIPGEDDLVELREAVLGERVLRDRVAGAVEAFAEGFELATRRTVRSVVRLDADALRDVLASTYRGARERERDRADALEAMDVTFSRDLLVLRPK